MMWGSWNAAEWLWMSLGMLVFWTLVVAGVVWLVRWNSPPSRGHGGDDRPVGEGGNETVSTRKPSQASAPIAREILDQRYARGELTDDQYGTRREALSAK